MAAAERGGEADHQRKRPRVCGGGQVAKLVGEEADVGSHPEPGELRPPRQVVTIDAKTPAATAIRPRPASRRPGWRWKITLNGFGTLLTFAPAIVITASKLTEGAWLIAVALSLLVVGFERVHRAPTSASAPLFNSDRPHAPVAGDDRCADVGGPRQCRKRHMPGGSQQRGNLKIIKRWSPSRRVPTRRSPHRTNPSTIGRG
ncbi:hypothetical protein ACFY1S_26225 [Micromonospora sp. NPDC000663]|uniref:hypothetical protein n=1 Tax=Micromonospora sp. NPDC000663 TaxID=3364218 RepID=UPI003696E83D